MRKGVMLSAVLLLTSAAEGRQEPKPQARTEADLCAAPPGAPPTLPATLMQGIGKSNFPINTKSSEAQAFFNQGIAQMHSFWTREAERSFMQAAALDPEAAMAYWGISMTAQGDHRPAFQLLRNRSAQYQPDAGATPASNPASPAARAKAAIDKAMELRGQASERERLYIEALNARRKRDSGSSEVQYVEGLRKLVANYPDDLEAKSILALAIQNGYEPVTRKPREGTLESLALLKEILSKDPDHVGAHHYVIHGCEGGKQPQDAWVSCKRYPELVPNIPHALHMPGHIYSQSDRLEDAAHSFSSAALNELGYMAGDALYGNGHHSHNYHFLIHVLGLQGRYQEAVFRSKELLRIKENPRERGSMDGSSAYRQGWFTLMKTLVRFEKWDEILDEKNLPVYDKPRERAWHHWARGLAHASKDDSASARASLADLRKTFDELKKGRDGSIPPQFEIAAVELEGLIETRFRNATEGIVLLRKAARLEAELLYTEPPAYPRPVLEMIGRTALALGRYQEAEAAYREALEAEPGSGRAYWGLARALNGAGKTDESRTAAREFARAWKGADSNLPELKDLPQGAQSGAGRR